MDPFAIQQKRGEENGEPLQSTSRRALSLKAYTTELDQQPRAVSRYNEVFLLIKSRD